MAAPWENDPILDDGPPQGVAPPSQAAPSAPSPAAAPPASSADAAPWEQDAPAQLVNGAQTEIVPAEQDHSNALKMAPDDEAEVARILSEHPIESAASDARRFLASKGFNPGPATVDGFKGDSLDQIVEFRRRHGVVNSSVEYLKPKPTESISEQPGGANALARGIADVPTAGFMDEAYGVVQALTKPSGHGFEHDMNAAIDRYRGAVDSDEKDHPGARLAGQVFGGLAIPITYEGVALREFVPAARQVIASGGTREAAILAGRQAAARGVRNAMIRDGAYIGGAHGVGSGEGVEGRIGQGVTEAGIGAAGGAVTGVVGQAVAPKMGTTASRFVDPPANQEFAEAADRQGVTYMAADLPNSPVHKGATAVNNVTVGGIPLTEQGAANVATGKAARDRIADNIGSVADTVGGGQAAQRGTRQWMADTEGKASQLMQAIPVADDAPAVLTNTAVRLANLTSQFASNPKLAARFNDPELKGYLNDLMQHGLSWGDLKAFRTRIGTIIGKPSLTSNGQQDAELRSLYAALSEDIRATAANHGADALKAWERWNTYYRARANRIENVVSGILGKNNDQSAQKTFEAIQRLAKDRGGDPIKLGQTLRSMPEDEANSVRATIFSNLGQASKGRQNDTGDVFSPDMFVTHWNDIHGRAKAILFSNQHRRDIDDIAKVFSGMKASKKWENTSKTGVAVVASTHTLPLLMSNPVMGGLSIAMQYGGGKLLASPRYARWLAGFAKKPNKTARLEQIGRLSNLAKAEPAIASDVLSLQQRLTEAFGTAPMKAAASDDNSRNEQTPQ